MTLLTVPLMTLFLKHDCLRRAQKRLAETETINSGQFRHGQQPRRHSLSRIHGMFYSPGENSTRRVARTHEGRPPANRQLPILTLICRSLAKFSHEFVKYLCFAQGNVYYIGHRGKYASTPRLPQVPAPPVGAFLLCRCEKAAVMTRLLSRAVRLV